MSDWDFILAPSAIKVEFKVDEIGMLIHSLRLMISAGHMSGFSPWITETAAALDEEHLFLNGLAVDVLDNVACKGEYQTFPELMAAVDATPASDLPGYLIGWMREKEDYPGDEALLASEDAFISHAQEILAHKIEKGHEFDEDAWRLKYQYMMNSDKLRETVTEHLHFIWDNYLRAEWKRVKPMLEAAANAFEQMDYSNMTGFDIVEAVTGRNMRGNEWFHDEISNAEKIAFIPSAHIGPYIGWSPMSSEKQLTLFFGARLPKDTKVKSAELNRSELLVRLNALADETRLKMLELLTQHEELCAQDFITSLELSQSSASRHLRQLTASGYISERRRDVAKCYSLNPERIDDTIRALKDFLRK